MLVVECARGSRLGQLMLVRCGRIAAIRAVLPGRPLVHVNLQHEIVVVVILTTPYRLLLMLAQDYFRIAIFLLQLIIVTMAASFNEMLFRGV